MYAEHMAKDCRAALRSIPTGTVLWQIWAKESEAAPEPHRVRVRLRAVQVQLREALFPAPTAPRGLGSANAYEAKDQGHIHEFPSKSDFF